MGVFEGGGEDSEMSVTSRFETKLLDLKKVLFHKNVLNQFP